MKYSIMNAVRVVCPSRVLLGAALIAAAALPGQAASLTVYFNGDVVASLVQADVPPPLQEYLLANGAYSSSIVAATPLVFERGGQISHIVGVTGTGQIKFIADDLAFSNDDPDVTLGAVNDQFLAAAAAAGIVGASTAPRLAEPVGNVETPVGFFASASGYSATYNADAALTTPLPSVFSATAIAILFSGIGTSKLVKRSRKASTLN